VTGSRVGFVALPAPVPDPAPAASRPIPDDGPRAAGGGNRVTGSGVGVVVLPAPDPGPAASRPHPEPEPRISTEPRPSSVGKSLLIRAFRRYNQVNRGWSALHASREVRAVRMVPDHPHF
jgi:hypothetical protein